MDAAVNNRFIGLDESSSSQVGRIKESQETQPLRSRAATAQRRGKEEAKRFSHELIRTRTTAEEVCVFIMVEINQYTKGVGCWAKLGRA